MDPYHFDVNPDPDKAHDFFVTKNELPKLFIFSTLKMIVFRAESVSTKILVNTLPFGSEFIWG